MKREQPFAKPERRELDEGQYHPPLTQSFDQRFLQTSEYIELISCLRELRRQRSVIIEERNMLLEELRLGSEDPVQYVEKLVNYEHDLQHLPKRDMKIISLPKIRFSKFNNMKSKGSRKAGVKKNKKKTASFNRPWTPLEQKKLERLLDIYPDETIASHRWEKIARALGNRTPKQVASRVQKYFIKLAKAGLPVPGKPPNLQYYTKTKKENSEHSEDPDKVTIHTGNIAYYKPPPVLMPEIVSNCVPKHEVIIQPIYTKYDPHDIVHYSYECVNCKDGPIIGVRYKCLDCPVSANVNICKLCKDNNYESETHLATHSFQEITKAETPFFIDSDYTKYNTGDQLDDTQLSYLDPNFMSM
eukprot:TRINITY_DN3825_c0_g1_i1.p1 TRINITY_DN3825_c0_g1~~TRINITY_DN3825_c0_g1_i1.p1  ORF type:complete len:358 (+),score=64.11 TRINITY_DN3825_c0_g1_i1:255-1328(+)